MAAPFSIRKALQAMLGLAIGAYASTQYSAADPGNNSYKDNTSFRNQMLNSTNKYRSMYGASSLTWNNNLASYAQNAANGCVFEHTGGPYGENIAEGYPSTTDACQAWGDERLQYSFSNPGFTEATGHFSQLVWKDTQQVGCGAAYCGDTSGWYVVCEYQPAGNVIGSFAQQVGTLVAGSTLATTSKRATQTVPMQTVAAATSSLAFFTGAADKNNVGGAGMAVAGVVGAMFAFA